MFARQRLSIRGALAVALSLGLALAPCGCVVPTPVERAMSLSRQHRDPEAIAVLRARLGSRPDDLDARRLLIRVLAITSELPAARDEVAELAKRLPEGDPTAWIELGHALELTHRFEEAMAAYQTASERAPASPRGPLEAGTRAARWGEWGEARTWLEEAIRRGDDDAETWHTLGLVRLNLHDLDAAADAYRHGATRDPKGVECLLGLATVSLARSDWPNVLASYDAVMARRPGWGDGELGRAWALARLGRRDDAAHALDRAAELGCDGKALAKQRALLDVPAAGPSMR